MLPQIPVSKRLSDLGTEQREVIICGVFLMTWLGIGTLSYAAIEQWPLLDGLYMSFITLTTIGFSETHDLSNAGRIFTILFAFVGIGVAAFGATRVAQMVVSARIIRERRLARRIRRMESHYIICGYGRIGRRVVKDLRAKHTPLVVLDRKHAIAEELRKEDIPHIQGDATDEATLKSAGIERASGLITLLPEDSLNVFVTLLGRDLNSDLFIMARTTNDGNRRRLLQAGASRVVAPTNIGAIRMAQVILRPNVDDFLTHVLKTDENGLIMDEVVVEADSFLAGKTLASARFRQHFEAIVLSVIRADSKEQRFNPGPHDPINSGDMLIVLGSQEMIDGLKSTGCTPGNEPAA